jgi:hypothetical protein
VRGVIVQYDAEYDVKDRKWWLRYTWIESSDRNMYEIICPSKRWVSHTSFPTLSELHLFVTEWRGPLGGSNE